ncbi:unnamed protein product [Alopecurus aequalis]
MEIAAYQQPFVLRRKRALAGCEAFGVKTDDALGVGARSVLQQRFESELAAVRRLVLKAAALQRSEEPPTKKIKASPPPPPPVIKAPKKMTRGERGQLKADVEKVASELPHHIMELLKKQSRAIHGDEMEIDLDAVQDEALLELRKQLDEFVRERADQEHQEEDEDVDIVGGVSPLAIVSAPLPLALEEDEEYVDICGDASPVAMPKNLGDGSGSPSSSSSSDSDTDSDSDYGSDSDSDESVDSPAPAERAATPPQTELIARAKDKESLERQRKEARCRAREKARQDVLETERRAMPSETIHPTVIQSLHIHEYCLGPYSLLPGLGLVLKADDDQEEQQHQIFQEELEEGEILDDYGIGKKQHCHRQSFPEELEEGEILG